MLVPATLPLQTMLLKPLSVATSTMYSSAWLALCQVSVGCVGWLTALLAGLTSVGVAGMALATSRVKSRVRTVLPDVLWTVSVCWPGAAPAARDRFSVDCPFGGTVTAVGLKLPLMPAGRAGLKASDTVPLKPLIEPTFTVTGSRFVGGLMLQTAADVLERFREKVDSPHSGWRMAPIRVLLALAPAPM